MRAPSVPVIAGLALVGALGGTAGLAGCHRREVSGNTSAQELPIDYATLPAFELTERSGRVVRSEDLKGTVWVAGFIFTRCHQTCPMVTGRMAELRAKLPESARLVTITVDPRYDRPKVLEQYAKNYSPSASDGWWFVTGEPESIVRLVRDGFKLPIAELRSSHRPIEEEMTHTSRLALVDQEGRIRGYFEVSDSAAIDLLARRVKSLLRERP